jgi:hypothetical protein
MTTIILYRRIGVLTGDGRLEVRYADQNGDDPFDWYVDWGILAIYYRGGQGV